MYLHTKKFFKPELLLGKISKYKNIDLIVVMATIEELEQQVKAQGEIVKAAKAADKNSDETKAAVAKLLEIKRAITAINPDHPQAIKKREEEEEEESLKW